MEKTLRIDEQIMKTNKVICRHISNIGNATRGEISQDILAQLRHFVEHIMLKEYANGQEIEDTQENITQARKFVKNENTLNFLARFYHFLVVSVSHRTLGEENAERLMLKYYEYLFKVRKFLREKYSMEVLNNLEEFPTLADENLREYYEKIAQKIDIYNTPIREGFKFDRFYIQGTKPFYINGEIYYEISFITASDKASKTDRIIAFTNIEMSSNYAVKLAIANDTIEIWDKQMPIRIIVDWEVSIRPCEFANFSQIIYKDYYKSGRTEQKKINEYLTKTGYTLSEVVEFDEEKYRELRNRIITGTDTGSFFEILDRCRELLLQNCPGSNVLLYLLYHMNNRVIKKQYKEHWRWNVEWSEYECVGGNYKLSGLFLAYECIPFDSMPFCSALKNHIPSLVEVCDCLNCAGREHEMLAWMIKNNTEQKGKLFTPLEINEQTGKYCLGDFTDIESLVRKYNQKLYDNETQQARKLVIENGYLYIEGYKEDTVFIISKICSMADGGLENYSNKVRYWMQNDDKSNVSEEKKKALEKMFVNSKVSVVYGAAGTGKTTLISYISTFFKDNSILYLAHTNPAVNNLKRKVIAPPGSEYMTISKFINKRGEIKREFDILIIDECSTVSNRNMKEVLELIQCKLIILVGDTYQIESIEFGNWFGAIRNFLPKTSVVELTKPYRSSSDLLLGLWDNVRKMSDDILDRLQAGEFSANLDLSIFTPAADNEIILCLNYGGLYGINNINHFMQENNSGKEIMKGIQRYKVGDPILFNDVAENFFETENSQLPAIHNNMKGKIKDFRLLNEGKADECIQFDIELEKPLLELDSDSANFEIVGINDKGNSIIRFEVYKNKSTDEDDDDVSKSVVPFQISYAVGIHKAQGLEYDSVKIVITDEIDELISHSIFYTAITRAREKLKIYWTQNVEQKILARIKPMDNYQDVSILKREIH